MKKQDLLKTLPVSRRVFSKLSLSGMLMMAAPLHYAYSQTSQKGIAKRFIAFIVPGGVWHPTYASGNGSGIVFGESVKALEPYKDQIVAFKGLNNVAATNKNHHDRGMCSVLTAFEAPTGKEQARTLSRVRSSDQILSDHIGKNTFFKSIETGALPIPRVFTQSRMVYSAPGTVRNPVRTARGLFDKLYKGKDFSHVGEPTESNGLNEQRKSALDAVIQQIAIMERELTGDDKARMQQHLNSVREIEQRLQSGSMTNAGEYCAPPSNVPSGLNLHQETDLLADMTAQALICGLTNVITFQVDREGCESNYEFLKPWTDQYGPRGKRHHSVTHDESFRSKGSHDAFISVDKFWSSKAARILKLLNSIPEDGGTMLDNTVMLFGSSLSRPNNHSHRDLRWMLIGGKGLGRWRTNRFVDARDEKAHNLQISMLQACGLDIQTLGNKRGGDGPLSVL